MPPLPPTTAQRLAARELPSSRAVMRQSWRGLLFLHWPIEPDQITKRLPKGLHVDIYDAQAWIGIVPFFMDAVRPCGLPPLPWLSSFHELNVRTYVYDDQGNPGVWFFSLDCDQPIAVEIARRLFHLPYQHAAMHSSIHEHTIHYSSQRRSSASTRARYDYPIPAVSEPAKDGSLEWFLVERYRLFSANPKGELFSGLVHHEPYQISTASVVQWSAEPLIINGFKDINHPPSSVLCAKSVDVLVYPLARC